MIRLPAGFVPIKYPGYFWNVEEQQLYTIKIGGVLNPLAKFKGFQITKWGKYNGTLHSARLRTKC